MARRGPTPSVRWHTRPALPCLILTAVLACVAGQENAGMTIPNSLLDCYSNGTLWSRQGLPTFGIGQLIDIIRKVESYPYTRLDLKNMAVQLTHRFRQDGIRRSPGTMPSDGVIPFTPSGPEFFRHMILLTKLIPGNAYTFPNTSLSTAEQCALHFMMSTTVDDMLRPSEDCTNLKNYETDVYGTSGGGSSGGYYQSGGYGGGRGGGYNSGVNWNSRRAPQAPTRGPRRSREAGIDSDVEILDPTLQAEVEQKRAAYNNYAHSKCPIQSGVVFTPWGSVSAGTVIAGIAAGLVPQSVPGEMLSASFPRSKYYTMRNGRNPGLAADTMGSIDNKWAATFSGDLAQVALLVGPQNNQNTNGLATAVGLAGGWNSTQEPRHYFLSQLLEGAMSEAAVRGCIDGLVMGSYVSDWYSRSGSYLKLSQLLDMYYSERGVFDRSTRACLRRERFGDVATTQTLSAQTEAFSKFYGANNPITVTMTNDVIIDLSDRAVSSVQSFIPTLNDPTCTTGTSDLLVRPFVNMIVVLDATFSYLTIHPTISYLMDKIDAGLGSKVMILNGKDGSILFNSSYPRLDWGVNYTQEMHDSVPHGFDLMTALGASMQRLREHDYDAYQRRVPGGRGEAVLLVTMQGLGSYDQNNAYERVSNFRQLYPDVEMLVLTQGNRNAFSAVTNDTDRDVFTLNPSDPGTSVRSLVERLKAVPRRIRNANCDPDWLEGRTGNMEFADYVEPLGVNYYRIAPNNFYRITDEYAKVRVQSQGYGTLTVCYSRSMPAMNGTKNTLASQSTDAGTCQQLSSNGIEIKLNNLCPDAWFVKDCAPLYLAVSATQATQGSTSMRCTDDACRFPDMLKFTVILERVGCWSAASGLQAAGLLTTLLLSLSLRLA